MTQNQLAYQANKEKERANLENEKINRMNAQSQKMNAESQQLNADTQRKLAVYQAYNLQRQGDAAGAQKWSHYGNFFNKVVTPLLGIIGTAAS